MTERKAVYYGQVELIPGIICDGYVLDDDTAVMSERGTADLLGMDQKHLNRVRTNWPPKVLKQFIDKGLSVRTNLVEVVAQNSPHCHREIVSSAGIVGATFSNIIPKRSNERSEIIQPPTCPPSISMKIGNTFKQ